MSSSPETGSPMSTSPDTGILSDDRHCYENSVLHDDAVYADERFVSAFGQKGRRVGQFEDAKDIFCLPDDQLLVTDMVVGRLQRFSRNCNTVTIIAPHEISHAWSACVTETDDIVISLCNERCVKVLNQHGDVLRKVGVGMLQLPTGVACDTKGRIIVCDENADRVMIFDNNGKFIKYLGHTDSEQVHFSKPRYVCVSYNGDIIISDSGNHSVKVFNLNDEFVRSFGSFGKGDGQFKCPYGVCTNKYGEIFVADHYNSRISMFTKDGEFIRHIVTNDHGLIHPQGLRIDKHLTMYITHGHIKATEVLVFKLSDNFDNGTYSHQGEYLEIISHV